MGERSDPCHLCPRCCAQLCCAVPCGAKLCCAVLCRAVMSWAVQCRAVLSCGALCRAVLNGAVLCRTVLNGVVLCRAGQIVHTHTHCSVPNQLPCSLFTMIEPEAPRLRHGAALFPIAAQVRRPMRVHKASRYSTPPSSYAWFTGTSCGGTSAINIFCTLRAPAFQGEFQGRQN